MYDMMILPFFFLIEHESRGKPWSSFSSPTRSNLPAFTLGNFDLQNPKLKP